MAATPNGKTTLITRHWMSEDSYQEPGLVQTRILLHIIESVLTEPNLGQIAVVHRDPTKWAERSATADIEHLQGMDFVLDGHPFGWFTHRFEVDTPIQWAQRSVRMALGLDQPAAPRQSSSHNFDRGNFDLAVRQALQRADRPDLLLDNPLLSTPLAADTRCPAASTHDAASQLVALIAEQATMFHNSPRDEILYQILDLTYFRPLGKQRAVAAHLRLSYGTYRRYLASAQKRLIDALWQRL